MKKIAIITFQRAPNYGAVLQAYAFKKAIQILGCNCDIIDYALHCPPVQRIRHILRNFLKQAFKFREYDKDFTSFIKKYLLSLLGRRRTFLHFTSFVKKYLLDTPLYKKSNVHTLNDKYDIFISGSDQLWNGDITYHDTTYFLDFVKDNNKKFSYASSFGRVELTKYEKKLYAPLLKTFNKISVREAQSRAIIQELTGKDVNVVLDPSLLLSKGEWAKLAVLPNKKDYVLLYLMDVNEHIIDFAKKIAAEKNCELVMFTNFIRSDISLKQISGTPEEFLGYFLNAGYVITNSFHGTAFGINLGKEFFVELLPPPNKWNSRLENILDTFKLRHRLIENVEKNGIKPIDFTQTAEILRKEKEKALNYLKDIIK